jgi:hypothetical protein
MTKQSGHYPATTHRLDQNDLTPVPRRIRVSAMVISQQGGIIGTGLSNA